MARVYHFLIHGLITFDAYVYYAFTTITLHWWSTMFIVIYDWLQSKSFFGHIASNWNKNDDYYKWTFSIKYKKCDFNFAIKNQSLFGCKELQSDLIFFECISNDTILFSRCATVSFGFLPLFQVYRGIQPQTT